jgi:transaldolase
MGSVASFFVSGWTARSTSSSVTALRCAAGRHRQRPAGLPALRAGLRGDRWKALEAAGAHPQRPLWASTGVKDPAYDDTRYVVELVAPAW